MPVYTYIDARQNLDKLLGEAKENDNVIIRTKNGDLFTIRLIQKKSLPYNLPDIDIGLTRDEIVSYVRESRER